MNTISRLFVALVLTAPVFCTLGCGEAAPTVVTGEMTEEEREAMTDAINAQYEKEAAESGNE